MNSVSELRKKAHSLDPIVRIGKSGLTDSIVDEIKKHVKKKKLIKIKMLPSFIEGKNKAKVIAEIVKKTDTTLIHKVGFVVVLSKKFK